MQDVVAVIGAGFVGSAIIEFFSSRADVRVYDINPQLRNVPSIESAIDDARVTFVAVPTPMRANGTCDTFNVEVVLQEIHRVAAGWNSRPLVLLKSTVPPGVCATLQRAYGDRVDLLFNPEFLTEAHAAEDFATQSRILLGGDRNIQLACEFYSQYFPNVPIYTAPFEEVELAKYVTNAFLALKVAFANEIWQFAQSLDVDYAHLVPMLQADDRLGKSHWNVPGPDGKFGFGGSCFPKDVNGIIRRAATQGVDLSILRAAWDLNLQLRPERDWEYLKGRAVV